MLRAKHPVEELMDGVLRVGDCGLCVGAWAMITAASSMAARIMGANGPMSSDKHAPTWTK